jgi:hypothetical protein
MTDFLTTLAARTLGLAPVMQPAIASIFSPLLVVAGDEEMDGWEDGERSNFSPVNSSLDQLATPDLPAISRLPFSQISAPASEFNHIAFNDETTNTPIFQNIEPLVESTNALRIQKPESLPVKDFSEVELKQSKFFQEGLGESPTSETENIFSTQLNYYESSPTYGQQEFLKELPTKSLQSNPNIPNATLPFATPPQPTQKNESQPLTFPTFNQQNQQSSATSILSLAQVETLINQVKSGGIQPEISNQIENVQNELRKLDKEKTVDNSKNKISHLRSSPHLLANQRLKNASIVQIKPLVDKKNNINIPEQQTNFNSANLSEYLLSNLSEKNLQNPISNIQPTVLPQQLSIYPQFETQMESKKSGRTNNRGEAVSMEQTPTPTIQVTIGRIEVRINNQTPSQTPRNQPNKSEPKLSLQDYLKKRQGGN